MSSTTTNLGLVKMASGETIGQWSDANNGSGGNLDKIDTAIGNLNSHIVKLSNITEDAKSYGGSGTAITNTTFLLSELTLSAESGGLLFIDASGTAQIDSNDVIVFRLYDGETLLGSFGSSNIQGKQWVSASGHYKISSSAHSLRWVLTTYGGANIQVPAYCSLTGRLVFIPLPA